ncbi:hypothetical protein GCM10009837_34420 [Streptomyces durmitorensis]|uniref:Uncharacterized protein n=1 Tax=Streptomyces durmitorensis TaxID=319947 RepID=A0ABY4PWZ7_9ACTN|nr:hypothetical protein [Streptomyces durmitorensis]UQT57474.1 hypothetical protein M4V62_21495 [Streptomyces durmitorensis]
MIPDFEVEVRRVYELGELTDDLTAEDVAVGFTNHEGYECMGLPAWSEVEACLVEEAEILARSGASTASDGIAEVMNAICEHDDVGHAELMQEFRWNDPGAAGLVLALSAAGTATFYSCRGGVPGEHHSKYPRVGLVPDAGRARLIARLAESASCGIRQYGGGWYLYARSVADFHRLAHLVLEHRDDFDNMPPPGWANGLDDALARLDGE